MSDTVRSALEISMLFLLVSTLDHGFCFLPSAEAEGTFHINCIHKQNKRVAIIFL